MRRTARWLGAAIFAASLAYLLALPLRQGVGWPHLRWDGAARLAFAAGVGLYEVALLTAAISWYLLLRAAGERPGFTTLLAINLLSQVAKYVPGNVAHYAGRAALARRAGLATASVVHTLLVETVCAIAAAAVFAAAMLDPGGRQLWLSRVPPGRLAAAVALGVGAAWLGRRLVARFAPATAPGPPEAPGGGRRSAVAWLVCVGLNGVNFCLFGAVAMLLVRTLFASPEAPFPALAGLFAAAWVAGFVVPGAPAGLGVREAVLTGGLRPLYGAEVALALPLVFRLLTVTGDAVAFFLGALLRRSAVPSGEEAGHA